VQTSNNRIFLLSVHTTQIVAALRANRRQKLHLAALNQLPTQRRVGNYLHIDLRIGPVLCPQRWMPGIRPAGKVR